MKSNIIHHAIIGTLGFFLLSALNADQKRFKGVYGSATATAQTVSVAVGNLTGSGIQITEPLKTGSSRKLFYLWKRPLSQVSLVVVDGNTLPPQDPTTLNPNYGYSLKNGWITFANTYLSTDTVSVTYRYFSNCDVVTGDSANGANTYSRNGIFTYGPASSLIAGGAINGVAVANADNDVNGRADIALANHSAADQVFFNGGGASPVDAASLSSNAIVWGDFDGDGLLDLAIANDSTLTVYKNGGGGSFTQAWQTSTGGKKAISIDFGDYDNDGAIDLVVGYQNAPIEVYRNQAGGDNIYTEPWWMGGPSPQLYKLDTNGGIVASVGNYNGGHYFGDWPGDHGTCNPIPCVYHGLSGLAADSDYLYVSNTDACTIVKLKKSDLSYQAENGAYDYWDMGYYGQCHIDAGNNNQFQKPFGLSDVGNFLYLTDLNNSKMIKLNKSDLTYVNESNLGGILNWPYDNDNDGQFLYIANTHANNIIKCDLNYNIKLSSPDISSPAFVGQYDSGPIPSGQKPSATYGGGHDNYAYPRDIIVDESYVYVSDTDNSRIVKRNKNTFDYVGEYDGVNACQKIAQDATHLYVSEPWPSQIVVLNKSDLSLVRTIPMPWWPVDLVMDSGGRTFVKTWTSPDTMSAAAVQWADFSNDGKLDIVVANDKDLGGPDQPNLVYRLDSVNSTTFVPAFTKIQVGSSPAHSAGVAVGDVDLNGTQDLVFANKTNSPNVLVYLNKPAGTFTSDWKSTDDSSSNYYSFDARGLQLADMNDDGTLDLVVAAWNGGAGYKGFVIYKNPYWPKKTIKVTTTSSDRNGKSKVTTYYKVNPDGTMGAPIAAEVK